MNLLPMIVAIKQSTCVLCSTLINCTIAANLLGTNIDRPGLLAKSALALTENRINIKSVGFAIRKVNIQFIVAREDFKMAIVALNSKMSLDFQNRCASGMS